eukprot:5500708-Heterocapsa_arctica.AAC.1
MHHMCSKGSQQWIQPERVWHSRKCHAKVVEGHEGTCKIQGLGHSGEDRKAMCRHCDAAKGGHTRSEQDGGSQNVEKR